MIIDHVLNEYIEINSKFDSIWNMILFSEDFLDGSGSSDESDGDWT
jgi:hypothetical protein